jgi:hypothetical protein
MCGPSELRDAALRAAIARYFPAELPDEVKTITLRGSSIAPRPFSVQDEIKARDQEGRYL